MKKNELFEIIGDIDEKKILDAEIVMKQNRRPVWIKWASLAACFALVMAVSIPVINHFSPIPEDSTLHSGIDNLSQPKQEGEKQKNTLVINEIENLSLIRADIDVEYSSYNKLPYYVWQSILREFHEFTGISYEDFIGRIPDGWDYRNFYSLSIRGYKDVNLKDEYRLHDYVFEYQNQNSGEAIIALCSFDKPLRDYIISYDNPSQSEVNGVPLIIYRYKNTYMVQFSYQNVNYDIETINISKEELEELLSSLISTAYSKSEDIPSDKNGTYMEAVDSNDLTIDTRDFYGGSYTDDNGNFVVVLTADTPENRTAICKELSINENNTVFKAGTYTLDYLTELQSRISNAMMNKELPFVVSSGVYETINRIKVVVTATDEFELAKLKAFDDIGGAIEIEVSSEQALIETLVEKK